MMQLAGSSLPDQPRQQGIVERLPHAASAVHGIADGPAFREGGGSPSTRILFPCNREDALLLLASASVTAGFSGGDVRLPVKDGKLVFVEDGLRSSESDLLADGQVENFPLLVELAQDSIPLANMQVGHDRITGLRFRNQEEADQFRYRPVEEFDTRAFECTAEPELFLLDGEPRFEIRKKTDDQLSRSWDKFDRICGGISEVLNLVRLQPRCIKAAADLLTLVDSASREKDLSCLMRTAAGDGDADCDRVAVQVTSVFQELPRSGARASTIISLLRDALLEVPAGDASQAERESRWADVAREVAADRRIMDGHLLSDDGSIFLRAALLASMVNDARSVEAFMRSEKPAGPQVSVAAAFLAGLKRGILDMPWKSKGPNIRLLSHLASELSDAGSTATGVLADVFRLRREAADGHDVCQVEAMGVSIGSWKEVPTFSGPDASPESVTVETGAMYQADELSESGSEPDSVDGPACETQPAAGLHGGGAAPSSQEGELIESMTLAGGLAVTVTYSETSTGRKYVVLRHFPVGGEKARKRKELHEYSQKEGIFWRPVNIESAESFSLCHESADIPGEEVLGILSEQLEEARNACFERPKTRGRKPKSAASQQTPGLPL